MWGLEERWIIINNFYVYTLKAKRPSTHMLSALQVSIYANSCPTIWPHSPHGWHKIVYHLYNMWTELCGLYLSLEGTGNRWCTDRRCSRSCLLTSVTGFTCRRMAATRPAHCLSLRSHGLDQREATLLAATLRRWTVTSGRIKWRENNFTVLKKVPWSSIFSIVNLVSHGTYQNLQ